MSRKNCKRYTAKFTVPARKSATKSNQTSDTIKQMDKNLCDELKQMKREIARLTEERDLLKNAAAPNVNVVSPNYYGILDIIRILFRFVLSCFCFKYSRDFILFYISMAPDVAFLGSLFTTVFIFYCLLGGFPKGKILRWRSNHRFPPISNLGEFLLAFELFLLSIIRGELFWVSVLSLLYWHLHWQFGYSTVLPEIWTDYDLFPLSSIINLNILVSSIVIFLIFLFKSYIQELVKFQYIIERLASLLPIYILTDILFASFYRILYVNTPCSFNQKLPSIIDAFYFSTVTITTLGFGDIVPIEAWARSLVAIEAIIGVFFIGTFIAAAISIPPEDTKAV